MLYETGIFQNKDTDTERIFTQIIPNFFEIPYEKPSEYVKNIWEKYQSLPNRNSSLNGKIFETILATLCIREKLLPLFLSAKVAFVPNVIYDLMFYSLEVGPICLSAKTSLRERYKQADLEAIALKYVHRKSESYLITLEVDEAKSVKEKIKEGSVIGLDAVIVATEPELDKLITDIKGYTLSESPTIQVVHANQMVTEEKVKACFKA